MSGTILLRVRHSNVVRVCENGVLIQAKFGSKNPAGLPVGVVRGCVIVTQFNTIKEVPHFYCVEQ